MPDALRHLSPPDVRAVRYPRNFIKTAVCELRFPALLELEARPPHAFQKQIRKIYPIYEPQIVEMGVGEDALRENRYLFRSMDKQWTVSVKSSAMSLETTKYADFEDFFERLMFILRSAEQLIDADFFTRVGLRYINKVPLGDGDPGEWINRDLSALVQNKVLGTLSNYRCVVSGFLQQGQYNFRHGMDEDKSGTAAKVSGREYTLDFDYYCENLRVSEVPQRLKEFNRTNFALFSWCLGPGAKAALGEGKPK